MAKLSAHRNRPIETWVSPDGFGRLVLRSDGALLSGARRLRGGYQYIVRKRGVNFAEAEEFAARLGYRREEGAR